jgi:acyl-coenzyme A thioesterase PaaI-like protein
MTPEGEPGVSDFGISSGAVADPARRAEADTAGDDLRFGLAGEVRRITSAMVGLPLTDREIAAAREALAAVADRLEEAAGSGRRPRAQPDAVGKPQDFFPTSPVIGFANPVAPPVVVEAVDGGLVGTAWFDYQYEGPPTCVHGGVIAMVFDEMLGAANILSGNPGMTGTLTIRYRKPTPLRTPLRLEARFVRRDGRKILTSGSIHHGDVLTAEAEGIFIELVPQEFMKIVGENTDSPEALEQVRADAQRLGLAERLPPRPPEGSPQH